jgi:hypothetical protein
MMERKSMRIVIRTAFAEENSGSRNATVSPTSACLKEDPEICKMIDSLLKRTNS